MRRTDGDDGDGDGRCSVQSWVGTLEQQGERHFVWVMADGAKEKTLIIR